MNKHAKTTQYIYKKRKVGLLHYTVPTLDNVDLVIQLTY